MTTTWCKKLAGLLGAIAFLVVGIGSYATAFNPLQSLLYGLAATFIVGTIGYQIGYIMDHPQGPRTAAHPTPLNPQAASGGKTDAVPLTGEETFLDDIEA